MAARGSILYSFYSQLHLRTCSGVLDVQSHNIRRDDVKSYSAILHFAYLCTLYQSTVSKYRVLYKVRQFMFN